MYQLYLLCMAGVMKYQFQYATVFGVWVEIEKEFFISMRSCEEIYILFSYTLGDCVFLVRASA